MPAAYNETIKKVRDASTKSLSYLIDTALGHAMLILHQQYKHTDDENKLLIERPSVANRFINHITDDFNDLLEPAYPRKSHPLDFSNLSIIDSDLQDAYTALQGMATHARNCDVNEYLRFTVRINSQYYKARLDESNNPLDPGQLAEAFKQAIHPVNLSTAALLDVYRQFNLHVLHQMSIVMQEANELLIETGIRPNLENLGRTRKAVAHRRTKRREKVDSNTRAFRMQEETAESPPDEKPPLLKLLIDLLHKVENGTKVPRTDVGGADVLTHDQLQELIAEQRDTVDLEEEGALDIIPTLFIQKLLEQSGTDSSKPVLDRGSSDIVSIVERLFKAIQEDQALPEAPRKLVGQSQLTILQIALGDLSFFENEDHPARALLNELAAAGIGWTHADQLEDDFLYQKARAAVTTLANDYEGDERFIDELLEEFLEFEKQHREEAPNTITHMKNASECAKRLEEIHSYAQRKIAERILDPETPRLVRELLENYYKKFLIEVILRDGPGGDSWKPVMDTIDVLLWSVAPGKNQEDQKRLENVNDKLMTNLDRAFLIAGLEASKREQLLQQLRDLQQESLTREVRSTVPQDTSPVSDQDLENDDTSKGEEDSPVEDHFLQEVNSLAIGMWFEFDVDENHVIRCTLAAKIPSIRRYIFVNRQGVKVVEQSENELARDLQAGTVRLINEGKLIDRAIDTVIANLRGEVESAEKSNAA